MGDIKNLTTDPLADADGQAFLWRQFFARILDVEGWTDEQSENDAVACLAARHVRGNGARLFLADVGDGGPGAYQIIPRDGVERTSPLWRELRVALMDHTQTICHALHRLSDCPRAAKWEADRYAMVDGDKVDTDSGEVME